MIFFLYDKQLIIVIVDKELISTLSMFFLQQFSAWVDAVIFVFSLENEASFNAIYAYYTKMSHYRNASEIPIILVGTQGQSKKSCFVALLVRVAKLKFRDSESISDC